MSTSSLLISVTVTVFIIAEYLVFVSYFVSSSPALWVRICCNSGRAMKYRNIEVQQLEETITELKISLKQEKVVNTFLYSFSCCYCRTYSNTSWKQAECGASVGAEPAHRGPARIACTVLRTTVHTLHVPGWFSKHQPPFKSLSSSIVL